MLFVHLLTPILIPAHIPIKNIGEFYNGLLHPFLVPTHVLAIVAVGLLAGQKSAFTLQISRSLMAAVLLGLLLSGTGVRFPAVIPLLVSTMIAAVVVTIKSPWIPQTAIYVLAMLLGLLIGIDTIFDTSRVKALIWFLGGTFFSASFASFYVALIAKKAKHKWQHIGIRIVASWICTICILMIALQLREFN